MNKKVLILICVLVICLCTLAFVACKGGAYAMKDFIVDFSKFAKEYQEGDQVDLSVVKVTASFTDGSVETIPLDKVKILLDGTEITAEEALTKITESTGKKTLEFKYSDKSVSVEINVIEKHIPVLTGVRLDTSDVAITTYDIGATDVSLAGLKVFAVYDETDEREIALTDNDVTVLITEPSSLIVTGEYYKIAAEVGVKTLKVRYKDILSSNSLTITVNDIFDEVVVNLPVVLKVNYNVGETIALNGITATMKYRSLATEQVLAENIKYYLGTTEVTDLSTLTATKGTKVLTVKASANGKVGTKDVTLTVANYITGISLSTTGVTLDYVKGDAVSLGGVAVNVAYADTSDNAALTLTSDGVACTYASGAAVDFASLTNTTGDKVITVTYAGKSDTFTVSVVEGETALAALSIESEPTVTEFTAGATGVTFEGLTIKAVYKPEYAKADEVIELVDFATKGVIVYFDNLELTSFDAVTDVLSEGTQIFYVYVEYEGKQAFFLITITNDVSGLSVDATAAKTAYLLDENADFSGIVVTAMLNNGNKTVALDDLTFFDGDNEVADLDDFISEVNASKTVTVKYKGVSATFIISVSDYITGIEVQNVTTDVSTVPGAVAELSVSKVFKSGARVALADGYVAENHSITEPSAGKQIRVTWNSFETTATLIVKDVLESVSVENVPTFVLNAPVTFKNLRVTGFYRYLGRTLLTIMQQDNVSYMSNVKFYLDDSNEHLLDLNEISAVAGNRQVKLSYTDNGKEVFVQFTVKVAASAAAASGYELPATLTAYNATRSYGAANQGNVTSKAFESAFFVGNDDVYYVGDDNPYKFLPTLTQVDLLQGVSTTLAQFNTDSEIYLGNDKLDAFDNGDNTKSFKQGGTVYVVENYTKNEYDFTEDAIGKTFTLKVKPSDPSMGDFDRVEWTVKVVDGFNVTESKQLCVLEQSSRTYWNAIKAQLGLTGVHPNAIILHQNTMITKDSIPSDFYYTLPDSYNIKYKYTDDKGVEHSVRPEAVPEEYGGPFDRTFLWDGEYALFEYDMASGRSFTIYGNYFDIDMSKMPLVAAFEPNGVTAPGSPFTGTYYGAYMSKTSFLEVRGVEGNGSGSDETFNFSNFAVKGNAGVQMVTVDPTSNIAQGADSPILGGGLIFVKSRYCHSNITNIHAHACFIPFFSRNETVVNYTNVKAYDSFQNALFVHSDSVNYLTNCHMKRANGPLMILTQGEKDLGGGNKQPLIPQVIADDSSVLESYVTGQSQWFVTYGVTDNVAQLAGMDPLLKGYFNKSLQSTNHEFDVLGVTVLDGAGGDISNQAYFSYKDSELDRINGHQTYETIKALRNMGFPTFFVASDGSICMPYTTDNVNYSLVYFTGTGIEDISTNPTLMGSFINSEYIVIIADGMGILTHFFAA